MDGDLHPCHVPDELWGLFSDSSHASAEGGWPLGEEWSREQAGAVTHSVVDGTGQWHVEQGLLPGEGTMGMVSFV